MIRFAGAMGGPLRRCVAFGALAGLLLLTGCANLPREIPRSAPSTALADFADTPLARLQRASLPEAQPTDSAFRVLPTGDFSFDARVALARRATRTIDAQYYQLHGDEVGLRFLRELRDAAARGVRVRLLLDDFYTAGQDGLLAEFAAHPNVELRLFNPLPSRARSTTARVLASLHEFGRINHRMHNKLFVVDNALAVTGGRNIGDEYFMHGEAANFIDMDVLAGGPIVRELSAAFDVYWNSVHVYPAEITIAPAADSERARPQFDARLQRYADDLPRQPKDMFGRASVGEQLAAGRLTLTPAQARVLVDTPDKVKGVTAPRAEGTVSSSAIALMRTARSEVVMASPYFIPGERGVALMKEGVDHGVHMTVLTNAADATDEPLVHFVYARYRQAMLRAGVSIYELGGGLVQRSRELGVFRQSFGRLHAKVATIDRRWVIVGSMNLDGRSARANTELSLVIDSAPIAAEIMGLVQRKDHLVGAYKLRLATDGERIEWVSIEDGREVTTTDEPGATPLSRLWLWMLSTFVTEDLLSRRRRGPALQRPPAAQRRRGQRPGDRRRRTDYSSCSGTNRPKMMLCRRSHGVDSGSILVMVSWSSSVASHSMPGPFSCKRNRYAPCTVLSFTTLSNSRASSGLSMKTPSSVFCVSERGSRFIEPMNTRCPSTTTVFACSRPCDDAPKPSRLLRLVRPGLSSYMSMPSCSMS
jgi:putative cardiolipin synthase